ncbi:MAG: hypothetical protein AAF798_12770 [Bacteroidota bacterium]
MNHSFYFSNGTKQADRHNAALSPDFVRIDEKTNADFLNFITDFSGLLPFWDVNGMPNGTWQRFFQGDLAFLLASIGRVDIQRYADQFNMLLSQCQKAMLTSEKERLLVQLFLLNLDISTLLYRWYGKIEREANKHDSNSIVEQTALELFSANIWKGARYLGYCYKQMFFRFNQSPNRLAQKNVEATANKTQFYLDKMLAWPAISQEDKTPQVLESLGISFADYRGFESFLVLLFESLYGTAYLFSKDSTVFLEQSLQQANHSPQAALLLATRAMMEETQQLLNGFGQAHLDFYYKKVLAQTPAAFVPDQVAVHFQLKQEHSNSTHPKGTALVAGMSKQGKPIVYKTTKPLVASKAKPVAFKTLYNPTIAKTMKEAIAGRLIATPQANQTKKQAPWPTLGQAVGETGAIGFALSDPILFMSDGQRAIQVYLELGEKGLHLLRHKLQQIGVGNHDTAIELFLEEAFQLQLTSTKAWLKPDSTSVRLFSTWPQHTDETGESVKPTAAYGLCFTLQVADDQPPIAVYQAKIHGPGYSTTAPLLTFELQQQLAYQQTKLNPYHLFESLQVQRVQVDIHVGGVQHFVAQNDFSVLKPQSPFPPFGVKPVVGSHFYLGNTEVLQKPLTQLQLEVEWYDLPNFPNGFCDYYEIYNFCNPKKPFYNSVFQWESELLVDKKWIPLSLKQEYPETGDTGATGTGETRAIPPTEHSPKKRKPSPPLPPPPGTGDETGTGAETGQEFSQAQIMNWVDHYSHGLMGKILDARKQLFEQKKLGQAEQKATGQSGKGNGQYTTTTPMFEWESTGAKAADTSTQPSLQDIHHHGMSHILDNLEELVGKVKNAYANRGDLLSDLGELGDETGTGATPSDPPKDNKGMAHWLSWVRDRIIGKHTKKEEPETGEETGAILHPNPLPPAELPYQGDIPPSKINTAFPKLNVTSEAQVEQFCKKMGQGKLLPTATFDLEVSALKGVNPATTLPFSPKAKYTDKSLDGFLRFTLKGPDYAFGHAEYPRVMSEVANKNMERIAKDMNPNVNFGDGNASETGMDAAAPKKKHSLLWNIFDGVSGVVSAFVPYVGLLKKGVDKLHAEHVLADAKTLMEQHQQAQQKAEQAAQEASHALLMPPRPAYIPKMKSISATYSASTELAIGGNGLFHIHPFGTSMGMSDASWYLLPAYSENGYLYMGLEQVKAPQTLTLLFSLNEGSGDRTLSPPKVRWSYLSGDAWKDFSPLAVEDGTDNFVKSGIVELKLPSVQANTVSLFADQMKPPAATLYWVRAVVPKHASAVCQTISVLPNATMAAFHNGADPAEHLRQALPPGAIQNLQQAHPKIAKVVQPVAAAGGKAPEGSVSFYTRVQERLRHKDRAVTAWDFERLVLQQFPSIGLARCLRNVHTPSKQPMRPGACAVVVLPNKIGKGENPLVPKTNQSILKQVAAYLRTVADPFAQIEVFNPNYTFLEVQAQIRFVEGEEEGRRLNELNKGLTSLIAPWSTDYETVNPFEARTNYFALLEYVNQQAYVDRVLSFELYQMEDPKSSSKQALPKSFDPIEPSMAWGLVTSVKKHLLSVGEAPSLSITLAAQVQLAEQEEASASSDNEQDEIGTGKYRIGEETGLSTGNDTGTGDETGTGEHHIQEVLYIRSDWYNGRKG